MNIKHVQILTFAGGVMLLLVCLALFLLHGFSSGYAKSLKKEKKALQAQIVYIQSNLPITADKKFNNISLSQLQSNTKS